eukprot:UN06489
MDKLYQKCYYISTVQLLSFVLKEQRKNIWCLVIRFGQIMDYMLTFK